METDTIEDSTLEKKVSGKSMGLTLGDRGIITGAILGVGYSLISKDAETGNYITNVITNFADKGYLFVAGLTTIGYGIGRLIDICKKPTVE